MEEKLIQSFYEQGDQQQAKRMATYMKDKFAFLGIHKPQRAELQKQFLQQAKKLKKINWDFVTVLWNLPEREFQYLALDYLLALKNSLEKSDIEDIELLIIQKSWWDSVDCLATNITGTLCAKYPDLRQSHILSWAESDNIWLA